MKTNKISELMKSKNLWMWIGVGVLAAIALAGAVFLMPSGKLEITPTLVNATGQIEPDTAFRVTTPAGMTEKQLREAIGFSPETKYRLTPGEDGGYILTPTRPLKAGGAFSVKLKGRETAYTVAKTLLVTSFMPVNGSTNVPVHTGIELEFNQDNVSLADFKTAITISPEIVGAVEGGDGRFVLYPQQALAYGATYTVTLRTPLTTPSGFALREPMTFTFSTITSLGEATDYLFNLSDTGYTLNVLSDEAPQVMLYLDERVAQPTIPELGVKIYSYPSVDDYIAEVEKSKPSTSYGKGSVSNVPSVAGLQEFASFNAMPFITSESSGGKGSNQYAIVFPEALPVGHYAVEYSLVTEEKGSDGQPYVIKRYQLMQSTGLSVFFMQTGDDLLLWVNDITTGTPVQGAEFSLSGDIFAEAVTGADGTALVHSEGMAVEDWRHNTGVFTLTAGDYVFADSQVFNPADTNPTIDYISYLFTDRPIYRTSDTIKVWGMVRPRNSSVKVAEEYTLELTGADPIQVKPDANGLFTAEISYENLGAQYWSDLLLKYDETYNIANLSLVIEDYVKPIYVADSAPTLPVYMLGHTEVPTVNIDVSLFDGTPVPAFAGNVESWSQVDFRWAGDKLTTDAKGRATIQMNINNSVDSWYPQSYDYRFSNADAENKNLYEYGNVYVIHRDLMLSGIQMIKDDKATVNISTNNINLSKVKEQSDLWKNNILKGAPTSTGVTATLKKSYYNKVYVGTSYNFISRTSEPVYRYTREEEIVQVYDFTTKNGSYTLKDVPCPLEDSVSYSLELSARDSRGAKVLYTVGLSPFDSDYMRGDEGSRYSLSKQLNPEQMKIVNGPYGSTYQDTWEALYGFVDDEAVTFELHRNEKPVEKMTGKLLSATVQKGFANVSITDKATITLPYSEALLPNYIMSGAYFDGRHAFILQDSYMSFNPEKRKLDIKLKGDKSEYAPKDPVKLDATVTNISTGKPAANAELVVAVVDEAIFALHGQDSDLLGRIYSSVYYPQISKYSSYTPPEYGGAGEKGGGGGEDVRSDFKDTAFFGRAKTDANGKAQFSFTMPDNITAWRTTGIALTDDNQAGNTIGELIATQKFFVTPVINETLIAGDSFAVGLRGAGKAVTQDNEVSYTVEVKGDGYSETLTAQAKLRDYATVVFDPPAVGDYTVTIRAKCDGNSDAVRLPFTVVPSGVERTLVHSGNLKDGISISPLRYPVRIQLYSPNMRTYNRVLQNLMHDSSGVRSDMRIARKYIAQIMERDGGYWYWGAGEQDISDLPDDMLSVLPYTQKDMDLTASMMLAVPQLLPNLSMQYFGEEEAASQADGSLTSLFLARAMRGMAEAEEIKTKLADTPDYTLVEKLTMYTALALAGDTETAKANYEALVTPRLQKIVGVSGEEVLYITGEGALSEQDCTAAAFRLAAVLEHKDTEPLILYLIQKKSKYEPYIAEQLLFLSRFDPADSVKSKVSYTLDGTVKTEEIGKYGISLSLSKSQLAAADFKVLAGEVYVDAYYTGGIDQGVDSSRKKLGITKTITPLEGGFETGKLVKITLTPDISGLDAQVGDSQLIVEDYIPTGMRFERYGAENRESRFWWLQSVSGQRLRFMLYVNEKSGVVPLVYYARCATPGDYIVESPYISASGSDIWGMGPRDTITIN